MSDYPSQWQANSRLPGDKSGVATFKVEGTTYVFALDDSADFHEMHHALDAAFKAGLKLGKSVGAARMRRAADDLDPEGS